MGEHPPRVVIVGGGFGGLAAAKALGKTPAHVLLVDRTNHHLFQPLLYQVATAVLTPGQIGSPIRGILRRQKNATVILGDVTGVDTERRCVFVNSVDRERVPIAYDYLILATGARHSYFGHDEFEPFAPGLKSLADAVAARNKILQAFEQAETEEDPARHPELLTFVLVGAGATGVELAGALAVLVRNTLRSEFRRIDPTSARIVLVDTAPRVLGAFADDLSRAAKERLEKLGVEVRLGHGVDQIDADGVMVAGERISSKTVIWTAGVAPSPAGKWLKAETDRAGRVRILKDLSVPGHPEIFVVGDTASLEQDGKPLPGVAQVAMQQGRYAGRLIDRRIEGGTAPAGFRYWDKGNLAVVGKGFAVLQSGKVHLKGFVAWLVWAAVHLQFLAESSLRVSVFVQWVWTYVTGQRGSRLIVNHHGAALQKAQTDAAAAARPAVATVTRVAWGASALAGVLLTGAVAHAAGAAPTPSIFAPVSTPAFAIRELAMFVLGITGVIFLVVAGLGVYVLVRFRRRRGDDRTEPPQVYGSRQIELAWTVVPLLIVAVLFLVTARYIYGIERPGATADAVEVTVVGHQWWWEIRYPKLGIVTANELHVPVSDPAHPTATFVTLQSADVVHSFWIPQLAGKMDVIPNRTNRTWIDPQEPGTYVGQCAKYCGLQHAGMLLIAVVHPRDEFARWAAAQQAPARDEGEVRRGRTLFTSQACSNCHTVQGTPANGVFGPDLTHLMSRATLGAGVIPNTRENLRRWVDDPASLKPGALMPAMKLSPEELDDMTAYLATLR